MKIVIDTNIAVSGLLWKGAPNNILKLARDGFIEISSTKTVCEELKKVLAYTRIQKRLAELGFTRDEAIQYYQNIVSFYKEVSKVNIVKVDKSDNRFLEAAVDSRSAIVVSGDAHLLKIKEYKSILIITAQEFLKLYEMLK